MILFWPWYIFLQGQVLQRFYIEKKNVTVINSLEISVARDLEIGWYT